MEGGRLSGQPTECRHCRYQLQLSEGAMATTFWLPLGYNFGCVIGLASDTLFDSRDGFSGSSYRT